MSLKKKLLKTLFLCSCCYLYTQEDPPYFSDTEKKEEPITSKQPSNEERWFFEIKPGYFYFDDSCANKIYNNGGFVFRAEADYRAYSDYLLIWFEGSYFTKTGHSLGYQHLSTKIQIGSITLGLKGIYFWNYCALYGGAGPRLFFLSIKNDSPYVKQRETDTGIGGGFTTGLLIFPKNRSLGYFDLFLDYGLKWSNFSNDGISSKVRHNVSISGLSAGVGLGVRF